MAGKPHRPSVRARRERSDSLDAKRTLTIAGVLRRVETSTDERIDDGVSGPGIQGPSSSFGSLAFF